MNKKLFIAGAAVVAIFACFALMSFDKKTRAQQQMEIQDAIKMQLDQIRMQEDDKCTERVNREAQDRFAQAKAEAEAIAAKTGKKPVVKRPTSKGNTVDPLPQGGTKTDPQKERGGAVKQGDTEQQKERSGASKPQDAEQQKKRGGAVKQGGGN